MKIAVAILGGTGFGAGELMRLLTNHPNAEVVAATSRSSAGKGISIVHPHLSSICDGQFVNLDAGAGYTAYEWSTGATTQTIQVTNGDVYGVLVTAANGCFGSDIVEVTVNPVPNVNLGDNQTICEGETAPLNAGTGFSSYAWNTGATGQGIQVT